MSNLLPLAKNSGKFYWKGMFKGMAGVISPGKASVPGRERRFDWRGWTIHFCLAAVLVIIPLLIQPRAIAAREEIPENAGLMPTAPSHDESGRQGVDKRGRPQWLKLEPGLDYCEFRLDEGESKLTALRIDPEKFDFVLAASGNDGSAPQSLDKWAESQDLVAAINASMYLPDNKTSTGYMRAGEYVNNPRMVERFGAFFVAGPRKSDLPRAMIVDKDQPGWREILADYEVVVQNYRMTNSRRKILWSPGGPLYSISAIAQDGDGGILFLHSRMPVEAYSFVQQLLHLPLDVRTVMYVEGGAQAGLLVRSGSLKRDLAGPHAPSFMVTGNLKANLPNVIGIRRRVDGGGTQ